MLPSFRPLSPPPLIHLHHTSSSLLSSWLLSLCICADVLFHYSLMSHSLTASPPPLLCSISSILSSFLAFATCCIHYQPLVMHIYCLQRARLIQHAAAESKSSPFPRLTCSLVYCRGQHKHLLFTVWFIYELSLLTFCLHPFPRVGRMPGLINCGLPCPAEASSYIHTHTRMHSHTHLMKLTVCVFALVHSCCNMPLLHFLSAHLWCVTDMKQQECWGSG